MAQHPVVRARVSAFGPFRDTDITFAPGLNVIVGDNATGKSQLLKLLYACSKSLKDADALTKKELNTDIAAKLTGAFRPDSLGRLTRRVQGKGRAEVQVKYGQIGEPLSFSFSSHAKREVNVTTVPTTSLVDEPVFLPSRELLSLSASFIALYDNYETGFEETWRDTVELLLRPALRGPKEARAGEMLSPFSDLLNGASVKEWGGTFYLHQPGLGNLEASLLAEGHRKLAMIVRTPQPWLRPIWPRRSRVRPWGPWRFCTPSNATPPRARRRSSRVGAHRRRASAWCATSRSRTGAERASRSAARSWRGRASWRRTAKRWAWTSAK